MAPPIGPAGVIFDLDGTLLNTLDDLADAMNLVLARHGWPEHPVDSYRRFVGNGVGMLVRRAMPEDRRNEELVPGVVREMRGEYARRWAEKTRPYPGVEQLLNTLRELAVPLAVLSNKPHDATLAMVRHFFPADMFRIVNGAKPDKPRKPDPTTALETARFLGLAPQSVLFLGDSDADMLTAAAADMVPLGAGWGFRGTEELIASGAREVLQSPLELLAWMR
jgi:phosphoglycolate phosphatase